MTFARCFNSVLCRPFQSYNSTMEGHVRDIENFCPFHNGFTCSPINDTNIIIFVTGLLNASRPNTIIGRIWTIIIHSVDGVFAGWFRPYVRVEIFKLPPPLTNLYAPSPIERKLPIPRIEASSQYMNPCTVLSAIFHSMPKQHLPSFFLSQTSTTLCKTGTNLATRKNNLLTALTSAPPPYMSRRSLLFSNFNNRQSTKNLACDIYKLTHVAYVPFISGMAERSRCYQHRDCSTSLAETG